MKDCDDGYKTTDDRLNDVWGHFELELNHDRESMDTYLQHSENIRCSEARGLFRRSQQDQSYTVTQINRLGL